MNKRSYISENYSSILHIIHYRTNEGNSPALMILFNPFYNKCLTKYSLLLNLSNGKLYFDSVFQKLITVNCYEYTSKNKILCL